MQTRPSIPKLSPAGRGPGDCGCTLVEALFLLVILTTVATLVLAVAWGKLKSARLKQTGAVMEQGARLVREGLPQHPWSPGAQSVSCRELLVWYGQARTTRLVASDAWQRRLFVGCAQGPEGPRLAVYSSGPDRNRGTADDLCRPVYPELGPCVIPLPRLRSAPRAPASSASGRGPRMALAAAGTALAVWWLARRVVPGVAVAEPVG